MREALIATVVAFLFIIAVTLLVIYARSGSKKTSSLNIDGAGSPGRKDFVSKGGGQENASDDATVKRRFLIFSGLIAAAFGALLVKLWSMQILSGEKYASLAKSNRTSEFNTTAPRGRILDRNGVELIGNKLSYTVIGDSDVQYNKKVLKRLSVILGIPYESIHSLAASQSGGAQANRVIATNISKNIASYIFEHKNAFEGISVQIRTTRIYNNGELASHVLGYAGIISDEELKQEHDGLVYQSGDTVGKDGAEKAFESYLKGDPGFKRVEVNASGDVVGTVDAVDAIAGNDVCLTIDIEVQKVAENALQQAFIDAHNSNHPNACSGAIVCLDCKTGEVIAMASAPNYNPALFVNGISNDLWTELNDEKSNYPLSNRCIAGLYPAASTFKGFTGLAGLEYEFTTEGTSFYCTGTWTGFGEDWPQHCWSTSGHGYISFYNGIVQSCDVVFYEIAKSFYYYKDNETALQDYVKSWGFGSKTGIELSGENEGRVPTPEWKKNFNKDAPEMQAWQPGDLSNLVIGQGDILVTPLQIACGYAGLATGKIPKPVLLHSVLSSDGKSVVVDGSKFQGQINNPDFKEENIAVMRQGFRGVVSQGSVKKVF
ncbi:MAG: penicillin-binding protein 2, partial [Coriobacteriales bacterium]|nr:penicillin-binding protein 2 [Coriobacteriales bacterium]